MLKLLVFFFLALFPLQAWAETGLRSLLEAPCAKYGVPVSLALAIARHESGGKALGRQYRGKKLFPGQQGSRSGAPGKQGKGQVLRCRIHAGERPMAAQAENQPFNGH